MDVSAKPQATVEMFSFATQQLEPVARLPAGVRIPGSLLLVVTRDGRSMLYVRFDQWHERHRDASAHSLKSD